MNLEAKVAGYYQFTVRDKDGNIKQETPWFKNLITNGGLDYMGTNDDYLHYCQVGTSNQTPSFSDSTLISRIAGTSTTTSSSTTAASASPYYLSVKKTFRFAAGVATGNIAEVGVGWASTGSLFSRTLVVDQSGNPTTVTVLSDETLDVSYEFRYYVYEQDVTGSIVIDGVTHSWTARAAHANTAGAVGYVDDAGMTTALGEAYIGRLSEPFPYAYTGAIGSITVSPTGTSMNTYATITNQTYVAGSYTGIGTITIGLNYGNNASGIGAIRFRFGIGVYQVGFAPNIMKTSEDILTLSFTHSWGRY